MNNNIAGYQIIERVYESSRSLIYRGKKEPEEEIFILKVLNEEYPSPEAILRFKLEYEIACKLNKIDGVIKVHGLEKHQNALVMILEDFGGESMKNVLIYHKISVQRFIMLAIQITNIIAAIHKENIIHKDINPANILYNRKTGEIKIIDFGIATALSQENSPTITPNFLAGTLPYMSPEQTGRMNRPVDYRTDFYSLGVTFYEMLTGKLPFESNDPLEIVHAHIAKQPLSPREINRDIPVPLANIILKLLAKNAEERYQSAVGLKADLQSCFNQLKTTGKITNFLLGKYDIATKFQVSQKLYGRTEQIAALISAFERVNSTGNAEMVLVSGYSGVGKTSLVQEIYKPITPQRGYFIKGTFEDFQKNVPYSSIISAFQSLIRQLLTENQHQIINWQENILSVLGEQARIIIDVIPELQLIIGEQPNVPELPALEGQNRFNLLFDKFISIFAKKEHPLVIFLDNVHWADSASLKLIEKIIFKKDHQYLLVICAYRNNHIYNEHPLRTMLKNLSKTSTIINYIELQELAEDDIKQLVADTLKCKVEVSESLAKLVWNKTQGNPFFANEFLKSLYADKLLEFNLNHGVWQWNLEQIQTKEITDNVIDLMLNKIKKLDQNSQEMLKIAAAIGNEFDLQILALVTDHSLTETMTIVAPAIEENMIVSIETNHHLLETYHDNIQNNFAPIIYKFLHNRVQQAAYSLITPGDIKIVHLHIGRIMLDHKNEPSMADKLFDIVNHINIGAQLITEDYEKFQVANLNFLAGKKAKESAAYEPALQYFNQGIAILPGNIWQKYYDLTLKLYKEYAECLYLSGQYAQSEKTFDLILKQVKNDLDKADVYSLKTLEYTNMGKFQDAIKVGIEGLKIFGIVLAENINKNHLQWQLLKVKSVLGKRKIEDLYNLPILRETEKKIAMKLLMNLTLPAYHVNINLFYLIIAQMINISLKYGNTDESAYSYVMYGLMWQSILGDYEIAKEFGNLGLRLNERFNTVNLRAKVLNQFAFFIAGWHNHLKTVTPIFINAYEAGLKAGDLMFTSYAAHNVIILWFLEGKELTQFINSSDKYIDLLYKVNHEVILFSALIWQHLGLSLQGMTYERSTLNTEKFDESIFLARANKGQLEYALYHYYLVKLQLAFSDEKYEEALEYAQQVENNLAAVHGSIYLAEYYFYCSLVITAIYPALKPDKKRNYWKQLQVQQNQLKKWADICPENWENKYFLICAEIARIAGQHKQAMDFYNQAIALSKHNDYLHIEALGNELAAKFYLANGYELIAKAYMTEARYGYIHWGANAKVKLLEEKYLQFLYRLSEGNLILAAANNNINSLLTTITGNSFAILDLPTVMKASQAISGEINLDKLLQKLMRFILQNAGAEKGFIILENQGSLFIEAQGLAEENKVKLLQSIPMDKAREQLLLPVGLVNYVARTRESIVLNDANLEGTFSNDVYINTYKPKSILCSPLINKGKLIGLVYLENSLTTDAFTAERLEMINLLSGQIAISIENACFYQNLAKTNQAYSRFFPNQFLQVLNKQSILDVQLGEQVQKEMSILFAEIRDFSLLSEKINPEENFKLINGYLSIIEPVIEDNSGFIDKYIGDAIRALFPNNADDAIRGAIGMLIALREYNQQRQKIGAVSIEISIGINTGSLMLGTVGGMNRMDSTVISEDVNLSERLEDLTKQYGVSLVISQNTFWQLEDASQYAIRLIDQVNVKGQAQSVAVFEVFDADPPELKAGKLATLTLFEEGLLLYKSHKYAEAYKTFKKCFSYNKFDKVVQIYLHKCKLAYQNTSK
jgi:predicted ATPase/class 3 adenylate cyclase